MSNFFSMSASAALFIGIIAVLRLILKPYLPRTAFVVLWLAALFRLLCPVRLPFAASVWNLAKEETQAAKVLRLPAAGKAGPSLQEAPLESWDFSQGIWLAVMVLLLAGIVLLYGHSLRESRKANRIEKGVYLCNGIVSPRVCGIVRPRILIPDGIDEAMLPYILLHERIHVLRLDNLWKLLALAAAAVHWFNPAAWLMVILLGRDLEVSCDEWVLSRLSDREKSSYALSLIAVAERCERRSPLTCGFSRNPLEERIRCIMKRKKSMIAVCAAAVMILGTTAVFATDAPDNAKVDKAAKGNAASEKEPRIETAKSLDDLEMYTAAEYREHMEKEMKDLKQQLADGRLSQKTYDMCVKDLKETLAGIEKGTAMAFYSKNLKDEEIFVVQDGTGKMSKDNISYTESESDGKGERAATVTFTITDEDMDGVKIEKGVVLEKEAAK